MTGRPPLNTNVAYAAGENRSRIRRLEAVRPVPGASTCDLGYEYLDGIFSSDGTDLDAAGIFSGESIAYVCGMGTPAAPVLPPEYSLVVGTCAYTVIDTAGMETVNGIRLIPTWWTPYDVDGPCLRGFLHVIGHGRIHRPHDSTNGAYDFSGPAVSFDLISNSFDMLPRMMYDGQVAYGGQPTLDGPEFTNVPWVWQDGDVIAAAWHAFTTLCGD